MVHDLYLSVGTVISPNVPIETVLSQVKDIHKYAKLSCKNYEVILVTNGISQQSILDLEKAIPAMASMRMLVLATPCSKDIAQTSILENSIGDYCIILDILNDPPKLIPQIINEAASGQFDIIIASCKWDKYKSKTYAWMAKIYYYVCSKLLRVEENIDPSDYTCLSRKVINAIMSQGERIRSLRVFRSMLGFKHTRILFVAADHNLPGYQYPMATRILEALEVLFSYSSTPLKLVSLFSFVVGCVSLFFSFYALLSKIFFSNVAPGWASLAIVVGGMLALLFFILGVFGFCISVIIQNIMSKPLYIIAYEIEHGSILNGIEDNIITRSHLNKT